MKNTNSSANEITQLTQYLVDYGVRTKKLRDQEKRQKGQATVSPFVRPLQTPLVNNIKEVITAWHQDDARRQGPFHHLKTLLNVFTNEDEFQPELFEMEQPELGYSLVANVLYFCTLDQLYVIGQTGSRILDLKNKIAEMLKVEWYKRRALQHYTARDDIKRALQIFKDKTTATYDQRLSNLYWCFSQHSIQHPPHEVIDPAALALISILSDPRIWKDGKTLLQVNDVSNQHIEFNPLLAADNQLILDLSSPLKQQLKQVPEHLKYYFAALLPTAALPVDWAWTGEPDCQNSTGGSVSKELRSIRPLGHGKHRHYKSVSSPEAIEAVNVIQKTKYKLDLEMADFLEQLIEISDRPGESIPDVWGKPKMTLGELKQGVGYAATLPEVQLRRKICQMYPDVNDRVHPKKQEEQRQLLGHDWRYVRKMMRNLYEEVIVDNNKFKRTANLLRRLSELRKDTYEDGFYWSFGVDHRGRVYEKADVFSPQDSGPERHSLRFAQGERLTEEALRTLKIAIGSAYAGTKISEQERLECGSEMLSRCIEIGADLFSNRHFIFDSNVDDPWLFAQICAGCHRYFTLNYLWDVPLPIDATQSAVQWWACLTNDVEAMRFCNLLPASAEDKPFDAYSIVRDSINEFMMQDNAETRAMFKFTINYRRRTLTQEQRVKVMEFTAQRPLLKTSLMTALYGSRVATRAEKILQLVNKERGPKSITEEEAYCVAQIIDKGIQLKFGRLFRGLALVKEIVKDLVDTKLEELDERGELEEFTYTHKQTPELDKAELEKRKRLISKYDKALEDGHNSTAEKLAKQLKAEEIKATRNKWKKRITDVVARDWRKDTLCQRSSNQYQAEEQARLHHEALQCYKAGISVNWTTPDGFKVNVTEPYISPAKQVHCGVLPTLSMRMEIDQTIDPRKLRRSSSPSFIHSLDATLLRTVARLMGGDVMCIHDSVAVLPSRIPKLQETIAEQMAEMIGSDGRELFRQFVRDVLPEHRQQSYLKAIDESFPPMEGDLKSNLKQARYMWN